MYWSDTSILNAHSPYDSPGEVFGAVCEALGKHYSTRGFRYKKSKPSISKEIRDIGVEIAFGSSRANTPGESAALEIMPIFRYRKERCDRFPKGVYLLGHTELYTERLGNTGRTVRVCQIYDMTIEREDDYATESVLKYNNVCDVMHITERKFGRIIEFIDKTIEFADNVYDFRFVLEFIGRKTRSSRQCLLGEISTMHSPSFVSFITNEFSPEESEILLSKLRE